MDDDAAKRLREFAELALKADAKLLALVGTRAEAWQWAEANRRRTVAFAEVWRALDHGPRGVLAPLDEREALREAARMALEALERIELDKLEPRDRSDMQTWDYWSTDAPDTLDAVCDRLRDALKEGGE